MTTAVPRYPETDQLERRLDHVGHAIRRQHLVRGLVVTVVLAILGLAVIFAFDFLLRPPFLVRPALVVALALWLLYRFVTRALIPAGIALDPEQVGVLAERRFPELQSRLISTLQFQAQPTVPAGTSASLVDGMIHQAFERSRALRWRMLVDRSWWRRWGVWLLTSLAVAAVVPLTVPRYATAFAQRLVDPAAEYPTRTVIMGVSGIDDLAEGDPIALQVQASGELPEFGQVRLVGSDGMLTVDLQPTGERGVYRAELPPLLSPAELTVALGDDDFGPVSLTPVPRVRIADVHLAATPPEYTGLAASEIAGGSARLPAGTAVRLTLTTSKPVAEIALIAASAGMTVPELTAAGDDQRRWVADFVLVESLAVTVHAVDRDGLQLREPPVWRLTAVPDRPPRIRLRNPSGTIQLAPASRTPLRFEVRDDYGLAEVALRYQVVGADGSEGPIRDYPLPGRVAGPVYEVDTVWENAQTRARPGEQVRLWVEARDRAPQPQSERSNEAAITVITPEAYRSMLWQRLGESASELGEIIPELRDSERTIRRLSE